MSLTINPNKLKFVIFGSGHDYTLNNSGTGEGARIFSHPFVPLNSVNYAGQYLFYVPDEDGELMDAVKDDIAHCTFEPALGTAFDTEGETTVTVKYHREYIHDEETIVVDKTLSNTVVVVNHGTVSDSVANLDVYSDGYGFIRPISTSVVEVKNYTITGKNAVTKLSSIPWRSTGLGSGIYGFFNSRNLTDISELAYADTSNCTEFSNVFSGDVSLSDISAVERWNVEKVQKIYFFLNNSNITSLEALTKWMTRSLTNLERAFEGFIGTSLKGLENFDVSNVVDMRYVFDGCVNLEDVTAVATWDMAKVQTLEYAFCRTNITNTDAFASWSMPSLTNIAHIFSNCGRLADLSGLSNWHSPIQNISYAFELCEAMRDISGVSGLDVSLVTDFKHAFDYCTKITSLNGLQGWDVSNGQDFSYMFNGCPWLSDISALAGWLMNNATTVGRMFYGCDSITHVDALANWRINTTNVGQIFYNTSICYSSKIGKVLLQTAYYFYDYEGRQYVNSEVQDEDQPLVYPTYDADGSESWITSGSSLDAFNSHWTNKPTWN